MLSFSPGLREYSITRTNSFSNTILALSGEDFIKSISVVSVLVGLSVVVAEILSAGFEFLLHEMDIKQIAIIKMGLVIHVISFDSVCSP